MFFLFFLYLHCYSIIQHTLIHPNKSEVSITAILAREKTVFDHAKLKENVHK